MRSEDELRIEGYLRLHAATCGCIRWTGRVDDEGRMIFEKVGTTCPEIPS